MAEIPPRPATPVETEETRSDPRLEEIEKNIKYAENTGRIFETAYWETRKQDYFERGGLNKEEVEKNLKYAKDTGRMLETSYWEGVKDGTIEHVEPEREEKSFVAPEKKEPETPLIAAGEVFDPAEELAKIKAEGDRNEKVVKLNKYKERLAFQKKGLATMQEEVIQNLRNKPDISFGAMLIIIDGYSEKYGFTKKQKYQIGSVLQRYRTRREAINKLKEEHPGDAGMFEALFGRKPHGKIEVITGPASIYFRCHDQQDYAALYHQKFAATASVSGVEIEQALRSGGVSIGGSPIAELAGAIIAENARGEFDDDNIKIYVHEEQHAIKRLFDEEYFRYRPGTSGFTKGLEQAKNNPEQAREYVMRSFRINREVTGEVRAKDEILAYMKEGRFTPKKIFEILTNPKGLYNYFDTENMAIMFGLSLKESGIDQEAMRKIINTIYVTEYHKLLKDGLESYRQLRNAGFSTEETIAILIKEPLVKWPKVVKRMVQ